MKQFHLLLFSFSLLSCSTQNTDNQANKQQNGEQPELVNSDLNAAANSDIDFDPF